MAATVELVLMHLSINPATTPDMEALQFWTDVANRMVAAWRPDWTAAEPWDERADGAAALQASRRWEAWQRAGCRSVR